MKSITDRILVVMIVALGVGLAWVVSGTLEEPITRVGDSAPQFSLTTDSGKTITPADFGGKLLVLNFWAAWCPPCVQEVPSLEAFHKAYAGKGVVVLGVSVDTNERLYDQFKQRFGVTFETSRDPAWDIAAAYGTFQLPETYVINESGEVVQKIISAQDWTSPEYLKSIDDLL